ncbi:hypothetical protein GOL78_15055 [Sinorhizobium medicae]|nr:hypothetical protein [Sinorhizobium medicae]MDX1210824.1 hypothetical protein [Sinorhizobium medicae]
MNRLVCTVGMFVLGGIPAYSQDGPKACSVIEDSLQRLTCFDKLFPKDATSTSAEEKPEVEPTATTSAWQIQEEKSPLDDSIKFTAGLSPQKASTSGVGNAEVFLLLRCAENTTSVVFSTSMFMTGETPSVTVRIGNEKATTSRWNRSTNYKAVGLWTGAQAIPFLKALDNNERLAVRIQDNDRVDAEFHLANVTDQVAKIREYCKW